jgi:tetratricopeptide (TPR) repeat protein
MAFEKAKALKAAEKFLSQGKLNAAIKEYRQVIENDLDDLSALNILGDLLARAGEKEDAIDCFSRIAEHYREQEFRLKAIAMYRKIEKLKPRDLETSARLAELYAAQGLVVDARAQYLVVADAYTRAGQTKESLQILHKIADLDSQNTDVRIKLAEGYLKEGMSAEAAKAFAEAAAKLNEKGEFERSLDAYSKALDLSPNDRHILRGLVAVHAALGTSEDAAELLEQAVKQNPEDQDLLGLLAQTYVDAQDAPGAERATALLMLEDATNYRRYTDVIRLYLKLGNAADSARILSLIIEPMLSGREENDLVELIDEILHAEPEQVGALRLLARVHWWQRDMDNLRSVLERLAESAEAAGLTDDERYALTQLVRLAPDEERFAQRLEELGGSLEGMAESGPFQEAAAYNEAPAFGEVSVEDEGLAPEQIVTPAQSSDSEFEWNTVAQATKTDASASFADLNEPETDSLFETHSLSEEVSPDYSAHEFVVEQVSGFPADDTVSIVADEAKLDAMMQQELESVDFYITQGYSDIAFDTLELLERQFGPHPEIDVRRSKLSHQAQAGERPAVDVIVDEPAYGDVIEQRSEPAPVVDKGSPSGGGIDSGLAEIFEEFRLEAEGDDHATSNEDFETHYNMATAYKEMDLLDEAIREFQTAASITSPADGTSRYFQCCNMLGHCFVEKQMPQAAVLWFKKGIEAPGRSAEEAKAVQYELGAAYEQMGDVDQAIMAFTEVYGVDVGYRDIGERLSNLQSRPDRRKKNRK